MTSDTIRIHYEDEDLIIVEKPAGISTQPLTSPYPPSLVRRGTGGGRVAPTLAHLVAVRYPEIKTVGGSDWGAAHRLDRETSGLVVFARNQTTYDRLREAFAKNEVEKEYTALVEGEVKEAGKIDWPIGPDPKSSKRVKVYRSLKEARRAGAQEAVTTLTPPSAPLSHIYMGEGLGVRASVVRVLIKTGRRHQIRAHLAAIGHPIVGDTLYGGPTAERMFLHASRIKFRHPRADPKRSRWVEAGSNAAFGGAGASPASAR